MSKAKNYKEKNFKIYQKLIEKLIYLLYSTKPNITFIIKQLNIKNIKLRVGHFKVTKRVVRYLKNTIYLKLTYKITNM